MSIASRLQKIKLKLGDGITLVAVSKYSADTTVLEAYDAGHRDFGENKAQDLKARHERFPSDIRWHFIGHLQRNKVKYIAPFVHLIHSVDSMRLLEEINKQALSANRTIHCLLQVHIAKEETKFGLDENELLEIYQSPELTKMNNIKIRGLMGMASNTNDKNHIAGEFEILKTLFEKLKNTAPLPQIEMEILSMGMSSDYEIGKCKGSNMVRLGSAIFTD